MGSGDRGAHHAHAEEHLHSFGVQILHLHVTEMIWVPLREEHGNLPYKGITERSFSGASFEGGRFGQVVP